MTNLDLTLFFAHRLLVTPEEPRAFAKYCRSASKAAYRNRNRKKLQEYNRGWNAENRERKRSNDAAWRKNNPGASYAWTKKSREKRKNNPAEILQRRLRRRFHDFLRSKSSKSSELVGCSWEELVSHITSLFKPGMSWENRRSWHIDHIRPLSSFDLSCSGQQKEAYHYTNLQPLWAEENLSKGAKWKGINAR